MTSVKALTIDFQLIAESMRDLSRQHHDYYLDKTRAKVISLSRDLIKALTKERIEDRELLPDWDAKMIPLARNIVLNGSKDYVRIPESFGRPEHEWRLRFTETINSKTLRQRLTLALKGRGSCKRFKEILKDNPIEEIHWMDFYRTQWKEKISQWLESVGLLAFEEKPTQFQNKT